MTGNENVTGGNGRSKLMNVLDQYVPVRNILTWMVLGCSLFVGGLKLEQFILDRFNTTETSLGLLSDQVTAVNVLITSRSAQRDAQVGEMRQEIADLTTKLDENHTLTTEQVNTINLKISNIVMDIATMKCQLHKC